MPFEKMLSFLKERPSAGTFVSLSILVFGLMLSGCSGEKAKTKAAEETSAPQKTGSIEGADLASGREIYFRYCHFCHGQRGMGDGPVGIALSPHPADFVNDAKRMAKTDAELFKSITEGIHKEVGGESMSMPRWQEILSEKERWDVLAYVRQLEREGKAAPK